MPPPSIFTTASLVLRFRARNAVSRTPFSPASLRRAYSAPSTTSNGSMKGKSLLQQLRERELVETVTGADGALERLIESAPVTTYAGVDSTANSLHVGHLLPLMNLLHFYLNGHHSIALIGKATASVGDPSGRKTERDSIETCSLQHSFDSLWRQIETFFETGQTYALERGYTVEQLGKRELVTNAEWLDKLGLIEFLSTVGRHARVSQMLARESVKGRMDTGQGINFAEFTYQLLQSYDFWHLHYHKNCRLQIGGNDQFGNITAGIDLIHKLKNTTEDTPPTISSDGFESAYGLTVPLLTTPSGEKFGKSAGNAVWLDENLTSPFELYQFFVRLPDEVVGKYLKMFTLLPMSTVARELDVHAAFPEKRSAQNLLAREVVTMVHGEVKAGRAAIQTRLLFPAPGADLSYGAQEILENFKGSHGGVIEVPRDEVVGQLVSKLARRIGAVNTRGEADNMIKGGGLYVGLKNMKVCDVKARVEEGWLVDREVLVVRFGKGRFVIVKVV